MNNFSVEIAVSKIRNLSLFSESDYLELHQDVLRAGINAAEHAVKFGAAEGRVLFKRIRVARELAKTVEASDQGIDQKIPTAENLNAFRAKYSRVMVFVSSLGNVFMREIAEDLALDLRRAGLDVSIETEESQPGSESALCIFVAPHEFFSLGSGPKWMREEILRNAYIYNTEQLQTHWFAKSIPSILYARGVFDISPQAAKIFSDAGIPSFHLEPTAALRSRWLEIDDLDHPLVKVLPIVAQDIDFDSSSWESRPIDISFFGSESQRRSAFFGKHAHAFSKYSTFIYYRQSARGPISNKKEDRSLTRISGHVAGNSKISLNVHRDEFSYFEWHRMVRQGMASGSLVVTDPCLPHPWLKHGVHFFQEEARHIPNLLSWLLLEESGREAAKRVVFNAKSFLESLNRESYRASSILNFLCTTQLDGEL